MQFKWNPNLLGWKYFNYILIAVALIVGLGVWVMPNRWADPEVAANWTEQKELMQLRRERLAREAEEKRIQDELGLVYIEPGTNPFPTEPPKKAKE